MRPEPNGYARRLFRLAILTIFILLCLSAGPYAEEKKNLPPRGILLAPEYSGLVLTQGESLNLEVSVFNLGQQDETITLEFEKLPENWNTSFKTFTFGVTSLFVRSDKSKSLTLKADPPKDLAPGTYDFEILAQTLDKKFDSRVKITVQVKEKKEVQKSEGVNLVTSYPVLRGPTDAKFEFSLEVSNTLGKDTIFNLTSQGPENWEINFKPAYEEKFISSLRLKENQSQNVGVDVRPLAGAPPGSYPITIKVGAPEAKAEATLTVILTGTYKMEAGTANGLLSLNAIRGEKGNLSIYVKNTGSAPLSNVQVLSVKPENWEVSFTPERIETLAPEELKQIEVAITPGDQALVGDYSVGISIDAGSPAKASKALELRVSVRASTVWGWIGIGIIIFVMAGLVVLFVRLGRR